MSLQTAIRLVELRSCPACKSRRHRHLFNLTRFSVFECECTHRFIDPSLDSDSMMAIYQSSAHLTEINPACRDYYEYETLNPKSQTFHDYNRALREARILARGNELLEVGCGAGSFLKFARQRSWKVRGVDSSRENIQKVNEEGIPGECCNYLDFDPREKLDCVVLWDLIEHPQDPERFIMKTYNLLRPGGLLVLATPHYPNLLTFLAESAYHLSGGWLKAPLGRLYMLEHTSYFSVKTLSQLLDKNGFKMLKAWKTETDLNRYYFPPVLHFVLVVSFALARFGGWQNRMIAVARKD